MNRNEAGESNKATLCEAQPQELERLASLSKTLGIPVKDRLLGEITFNDRMDIPMHYFKRMEMVPLQKTDGFLTVALNDPLNFRAADDLARRAGCRKVRMVLSPLSEIHGALHLLFDQSSDEADRVVEDLESYQIETQALEGLREVDDLMDASHEAPVIRLVNLILTQALRREASDIHIEPYEKVIEVRFRIDGILYEVFTLPRKFHAPVVSRLKVMAELDIAEKRVPQDGRIKIRMANRSVDLRLSIIPMAYGERIVLRILDKGVSLVGLEEMGMGAGKLEIYERLIRKNSGILLVTGPTGSGKTTTLYASINRINSAARNVITIEDPIEYELERVGQIQVNVKTDLTFARGLRSILRHDPDIIMVGEIRDRETAEIAVQASLTGHLVFSTLHTNDASGALTRLVDMGVEPFLIASSLLGVVAQRLVRKICPECREGYPAESAVQEQFGLSREEQFFRGNGCSACMESGYKGRTGIFELLVMDPEIRRLLTSGADSVTIRDAAVGAGMTTLFEDGIRKVREGITTLNEVMRVTQE
ncbi:MAG: type II secretion system ATPase GspE [Thermodesulfobacteriota bacterium]